MGAGVMCDTDKFAQRVVSEFCECGHMILAHSEGGLCAPCAMVNTVVYPVMPGDVVVYRTGEILKFDHAKRLFDCLRELFPQNKIGVLDGGGTLEIMRED